ncbi:MAG: hypothetical protein IPL28_13760 [Chloroflexi bacterium]|nr:hypothetical protein [Chloroflexota bacterium]
MNKKAPNRSKTRGGFVVPLGFVRGRFIRRHTSKALTGRPGQPYAGGATFVVARRFLGQQLQSGFPARAVLACTSRQLAVIVLTVLVSFAVIELLGYSLLGYWLLVGNESPITNNK